jgi:hypothetical protein
MSRVWQTIRSYIWWTHERGSMHYDVMVTLILAFIFLAPYWINFKDKPVERTPHPSEVVVSPDGQSGFIYEVPASAVTGRDEGAVEADLLRVIEPIAGEVEITSYEKVRDNKGRVVGYRVKVVR